MKSKELPVSVTLTTYNHEKYIAESIRSVLDQTFTNFELIVVNDGSTDRTDEIIRTFQDPRITYINQENQGPSVAINNAILAAKGVYVALMSGDDICYPQRLERQYFDAITKDKSILFSWVDFIDDNNKLSTRNPFPAIELFNLNHKPRHEILSHFFFKGNYLCAPTAFIKRDLLIDAGLFCITSIQLQDFDLWIKLLPKNEFYMCTEKLLKYRKRNHNLNLSSRKNMSRVNFESRQIYRHFFDNIDSTLFKRAFHNFVRRKEFEGYEEYELEKSFLYFNHDLPFIREIGVERLYELLRNKDILIAATEKYNFNLTSLHKIMQNSKQINKRNLIHYLPRF